MDENSRERYRQRYETWRHLDRIRYQVIQLAIGALAAIAVLIQASGGVAKPFVFIALSGIFLLLWKVLDKVNDAIVGNGTALREYGADIGDTRLPDVSDRTKSIFYYISWIFFFFGIAIGFWGILNLILSNA